MHKRPNECFKCTSRKCYYHIYSLDDLGKTYNEIACLKHGTALEQDADKRCSHMEKMHIQSTGTHDRRNLDGKD